MKLFSKYFVFTLVTISSISFTTHATTPEPEPNKAKGINVSSIVSKENNNPQIDNLLNFAYKFKGVPYRLGANGPHRFDCSGFTSYVFKAFGYNLARRASLQVHNGKRVERGNLKPGDLVFFGGRSNRAGIGHVGIITEVDENGHDFSFIHASTRNGITVNHSTNSYYRVRYRGACRVIRANEPQLSLLDELKKSINE